MKNIDPFALSQIYDKPLYKIDAIPTSLLDHFLLEEQVDTLIIVPSVLEEMEQKVLENILKALKYDDNKIQVVIQEDHPLSFKFINRNLKNINKILVYGLSPKDLQLNILNYQDKILELDNVKLLFTVPLEMLKTYKYKKNLWNMTVGLFS